MPAARNAAHEAAFWFDGFIQILGNLITSDPDAAEPLSLPTGHFSAEWNYSWMGLDLAIFPELKLS
jgi:hypothetical protein